MRGPLASPTASPIWSPKPRRTTTRRTRPSFLLSPPRRVGLGSVFDSFGARLRAARFRTTKSGPGRACAGGRWSGGSMPNGFASLDTQNVVSLRSSRGRRKGYRAPPAAARNSRHWSLMFDYIFSIFIYHLCEERSEQREVALGLERAGSRSRRARGSDTLSP